MFKNTNSKTIDSVWLDLSICLFSLVFMSVFYYGIRALLIVFIAVLTCYITDVICIYLKKGEYEFKDYSSVIIGLTYALLMPATVPVGILIAGCIITIVIGKQAFGGKDNLIFQPVAVGYSISAFCWKEALLLFPKPVAFTNFSYISQSLTSQSHSLSYYIDNASIPALSEFDILLGSFAGPMGTTHLLVLLVCAVALISRRSASFMTIFSCLITLILSSFVFPGFSDLSVFERIQIDITGGYTLFALLFLACEKSLLPKSKTGRFFNGIFIALLALLFRKYSHIEQGIILAILLANVLSSTMDEVGALFKKLFQIIKKWPGYIIKFLWFLIILLINSMKKLNNNLKEKKIDKQVVSPEESFDTGISSDETLYDKDSDLSESEVITKLADNSDEETKKTEGETLNV